MHRLAIAALLAGVALQCACAAPVNDNFASATVLSGVSGSAAATLTGATAQLLEPSPVGLRVQESVWFKWTAASASALSVIVYANFDVDTSGDAGSPRLALGVYANAPTFQALKKLSANDTCASAPLPLLDGVAFRSLLCVTVDVAAGACAWWERVIRRGKLAWTTWSA
jgi:hypothetical protein